MPITYDPAKREKTLRERGLDFEDAAEVFDGVTISRPDRRQDYGEVRTISVGYLAGRMVVVAWTQRDGERRIVSLRKANEREQAKYRKQLGEG